MDLSEIAFKLSYKDVIIIFKEDSPSFKRYNNSLTGKLIGRSWLSDKIISITIKSKGREYLVPANDIKDIEAI